MLKDTKKAVFQKEVTKVAMKHKVSILVAGPGGQKNVLAGAQRRLPVRLLRFLFGDFTQVYLLSPGESVESVEIHEVREGGAVHG